MSASKKQITAEQTAMIPDKKHMKISVSSEPEVLSSMLAPKPRKEHEP